MSAMGIPLEAILVAWLEIEEKFALQDFIVRKVLFNLMHAHEALSAKRLARANLMNASPVPQIPSTTRPVSLCVSRVVGVQLVGMIVLNVNVKVKIGYFNPSTVPADVCRIQQCTTVREIHNQTKLRQMAF
mmetsp:Transcript_34625/g.78133  ORF Transcript_34625/g.78133 Transcript_34625/m.78133 type:complete len:131 (+) Transcript_34625:1462-1854(+)